MSKSALLRPAKGKPAEVQGPLSIPEQVPAPLTVPEQVQTPQTILESAPARPERRGHSSVARRYKASIGFPLWLVFLSVFLTSLIYLPIYLLHRFLPPSWIFLILLFGELLSNPPLLLMVVLFCFLISLIFLPVAIDGFRRHIWRKWRYGYDAATDSFFRDSGFVLGSLQRKESWPTDNFVAIHWEEYGRDKARLWLKSGDNYEDLLLADLKLWSSSNERFAQRLAEELSAASGLPLIHRLPRS